MKLILFALVAVFVAIAPKQSLGFQKTLPDTTAGTLKYAQGEALLMGGYYDSAAAYFGEAAGRYATAKAYAMQANAQCALAHTYLKQGNVGQSLALSKTALSQAEKQLGKNHRATVKTQYYLAWAMEAAGDYQKAHEMHQSILATRKLLLGNQHPEVADSYEKVGIGFEKNRDYTQAMACYLKTLQIRKNALGAIHPSTGQAHDNIGLIFYFQGKYEQSKAHFDSALQAKSTSLREMHPDIGDSYNFIGSVYESKGDYSTALSYYQKSLGIRKEVYGDNHRHTANTYNNIGIAFYSKGQYDLSLDFLKKALEIRKKTMGEAHPIVAASYNNIGVMYIGKQNFKLALSYFQLAANIRRQHYGPESMEMVSLYNNMGLCYEKLKDFPLALDYAKKALNIRKAILGNTHPQVADSHDNLGTAYIAMKRHKEAVYHLSQSLEISKNTLGEKHPTVASTLASMGNAYYFKGRYQLAVNYFNRALIANVAELEDSTMSTLPAYKNVFNPVLFLSALINKSEALTALHHETGQIEILMVALQHFLLADEYVNHLRKQHIRYGDKVTLGKSVTKLYHVAVAGCKTLYDATGETQYLSQAFYFSEKSRAVLLNERLSGQAARHFAHLPDSLLQTEKRLKIDHSFYYTQAQLLKASPSGYDTTLLLEYEEQLFTIRQKMDALKSTFEKRHARYFSLKYANKILSASQASQKLGKHQALLEYYEGDSVFYVFTVSKSAFDVAVIPKNEQLNTWLDGYKSSFSRKGLVDEPLVAYKQFTQNAYGLYQALVLPALQLLPEDTKSLIIVPDGKLSHMPWEPLISQLPEKQSPGYKNLPYLFRKYTISYAHTASLHLDSPSYLSEKPTGNAILAFAPSYPEKQEPKDFEVLPEAFRDAIVPLMWNSEEIGQISRYFKGNYLSGQQATEQAFKRQASSYKVLHLAMHALIDDKNAMMSKLVFTQDGDSTEDGMLHTHELYNMDLSAELAVLSACNTGIGVIQKGEGAMSLGKAFAYAGCPSIVMSHWAVPDKSTAMLMGHFYKALAKGKPKDQAMGIAREAFLKNADALQQHPLYWSGFVVIGDVNPLEGTESLPWGGLLYWVVIALTLIGISALLLVNVNWAKNQPED